MASFHRAFGGLPRNQRLRLPSVAPSEVEEEAVLRPCLPQADGGAGAVALQLPAVPLLLPPEAVPLRWGEELFRGFLTQEPGARLLTP